MPVYIIFFIIFTFYANSVNASNETRDFPVRTTIDRSKLLSETVNIRLEPESITLTYDPSLNTFSNERFDLIITTNINLDEDEVSINGYELSLLENRSTCYSSLSPDPNYIASGYDDFSLVHLDRNASPMVLNESYSVIENVLGDNEFLHEVELKFKEVVGDVRYCSGSYTLGFRYDL